MITNVRTELVMDNYGMFVSCTFVDTCKQMVADDLSGYSPSKRKHSHSITICSSVVSL